MKDNPPQWAMDAAKEIQTDENIVGSVGEPTRLKIAQIIAKYGERQWVKCSVRMPKEGQEVWIRGISDKPPVGWMCEEIYHDLNWYTAHLGVFALDRDRDAWAPLSPPPDEE